MIWKICYILLLLSNFLMIREWTEAKTREIILTALVKESGDLDKYKNIYFNEKSYIKKNIWRDLMLPKRRW